MRAALQKANRYVELLVVAGGDHGFTEKQNEEAWSAVKQFFDLQLKRR
jgi:dipeptidyl aminopeptidase/acylaminoacyl peptidase